MRIVRMCFNGLIRDTCYFNIVNETAEIPAAYYSGNVNMILFRSEEK